MANVSVFNMEGQEVGTIDLNDAIFGVEVNENLIHMAVVQQLANKRQGTQKAKTRGEVSGGGRKPWRQKGTGHARQGSTRAPQWKGGGVVFAPVPRDYSFKMNKKEKRAALKSALTDRLQEGKLIVLDELKFDEIKTKAFAKVLENLKISNKALFVLGDMDQNVILSARNLPDTKTTQTSEMNVYDVMNAQTLVHWSSPRMLSRRSRRCTHNGNARILRHSVKARYHGEEHGADGREEIYLPGTSRC